ncbi:phage tail protein [Maribius pontilimi]|uniref:Phage tail protein n=1 Tax=Palleronia pontilimi TaxID=1964209 RepID=A0A934IC48_9RHOB|nr:phage tail protein [Palleronia pontilimi]MBJ3764438.1 phage tail protein [Palleronia pontilimi]
MVDFPLVQPVMKVNFFVTMWDTPDSNDGGVIGGLTTAATAVLNAAVPFLAGGFRSVEGLDAINELVTHQEGGNNHSEHRFYDRSTYAKIVLKRGITFNTDLADWQNQVTLGERKVRKSGTIILLDSRKLFEVPNVSVPIPGQYFPVASWTFHNALPAKLAGPMLDATASEGDLVAVETLELHAEKIERLSLSLIPGVADLNSALSGLVGLAGGASAAGLSAGAGALAAL